MPAPVARRWPPTWATRPSWPLATVFRGWTGERAAYAGFNWGDLAWQANPAAPVGINPPGATLDGHSVDGTLPDEQRRTGGFTWPPPCGSYPHEAVDGSLLTAEILQRAGYPAYQWGSNALLRAEQWLWNTGCPPSGDNVWNLPLLDARYGSNFWNGAVVRPRVGGTDWLYGSEPSAPLALRLRPPRSWRDRRPQQLHESQGPVVERHVSSRPQTADIVAQELGQRLFGRRQGPAAGPSSTYGR